MSPSTPKWESKDTQSRMQGLKELNPNLPVQKEILEKIAKNDEDFKVRQIAFKILGRKDSQEAMADIAINSKDWMIRRNAVNKVTSQILAADIIRNAKDWDVRKAAFRIISDQNILTVFALKDKDQNIRALAVEKLTDQSVLGDIAKKDKDKNVREASVRKLTDQDILTDLAKDADDLNLQLEASLKLKDLSQKTDNLIRIFAAHNNEKWISKIADKLKELYHNNELTQNDKAKIFQLKGHIIEKHSDMFYTDQNVCGNARHIDTPASYLIL